MKVLSLFSGVGGFDYGLENGGMETVFQCEWDKHATSILERHWPDVPRWGDITTLTGKHILAHAPVIDVVAWGSPCQDLSVAGKRAGLEGSRSGLFHEGVRIIKELRKETNNEYPRISIWENVYGALNSNRGADFGVILNEMAEAGSLVQEWRVLDAQYFGVPQRRRRVYLLSVFDSATAARCPDPLLPVSEGVQWHPSTSNQTRQTVAGEVAGCLRSGGAGGVPSSRGEHLVIEPPILIDRAAFNQGINAKYDTHISDDPVSPSLVARGPHAVFTKSGGGKGPLLSNDKSLTLAGSNDQTLFTPVQEPMLIDGTRVDDVRIYEPPVQTLKTRMGTGGNNVPVIGFSHTQGLSAQPSESAWPTLRTQGNGMAVAYDEYNDTIGGEVHHALRAGTKQSTGVVIDAAGFKPGASAVAFQYSGDRNNPSVSVSPELAYTLPANPMSDRGQSINTHMAVRRLTPLECERLMGWPDGWTATKADGTPQSDTHRYKQCGNGIASPVAQ